MFRLIIVFLGIPLGLFLIIFGGMGVIQEINLSSQGKIVEATITDTQTYTDSNGQDNYEVRYQFTVNGTTYSHADSTGRQNLWVTLPDQTANNTLEVIYLPGNPWVNRPTDSKSMESSLIAFIAGLIFFPLGAFIAISDYKKYKLSKQNT
jgi:hypothetical protein